MTASGRRTALAGGLGLAVGLGIGLGLGVLGGGGRSATAAREPAGPAAPSSQPELASALRELAQAIASLRASFEQRELVAAQPLVVERTEVGEVPVAQSPDLAAAIASLASAVRALKSAQPGASDEPKPLVVPAWVDRGRAFAATGLHEAALAADDERRESATRAFRQRHLFWTPQQVVDVYGRPDDVDIDDLAIIWSYENKFDDGSAEQYGFYFHDGAVYSVDYDFDEP
jgi:hypothetical protein